MNLFNHTFTVAETAQALPATPAQWKNGLIPASMLIEANFTYGSGGTTIDAWVQTTVDGGTTWIDVCNFSVATTSLKRLFNVCSNTPITSIYTPLDGTMTANTCKDGIIGSLWRVKYTSVGTYAGGTSLVISLSPGGMG